MSKRPADVDVLQSVKDLFFTANTYKLDDRFVLRDGKRHPFAILCPGGGYQTVCSFIEGVPIARRLNALGYSAFILYYRVKGKARFPTPQEDLAHAVREILAKAVQYQLDTKNYSVWGGSAGGHLAASFGTEALGWKNYDLPKPGAVVLMYPVISMNEAITHKQTRASHLGKNPASALIEAVSIEKQVTAAYPPTYLWCGDADEVVSPDNTRRMAAALNAAKVRYQCEIFPGVGHGVGPATGTSAAEWIEHAVAFWRQQEE